MSAPKTRPRALAGAGVAAVHGPAIRPLSAGHHHGAEPWPAEDESFGDELLHGAGSGLVAHAVLAAKFGGAR